MLNGEKENTLTLRVAKGLCADHPQQWAWEIFGDEISTRSGVAASQNEAHDQALMELMQFSTALNGKLTDPEPENDPVHTAIDLYIGRGIIASYPDAWAWELCSVYNGYSWGTADTLTDAVKEAQERYQQLKIDILSYTPPRKMPVREQDDVGLQP